MESIGLRLITTFTSKHLQTLQQLLMRVIITKSLIYYYQELDFLKSNITYNSIEFVSTIPLRTSIRGSIRLSLGTRTTSEWTINKK